MSDYIPYVIFGLSLGSIYGISAMGLVLTYKTSGLFNFAHGAVSAASAFCFYEFRQVQGLPWPVAAIITVGVFGPLSALILQALSRVAERVSDTYRVVATVGVLVSVIAGAQLIFGRNALLFQSFLPQQQAFHLPGVSVSYDNVIVFLLGVVGAVALSLFFRRTRLGTEMRAVVDDSTLMDITGTSPARVRLTAWLVGTGFASVSGVLFAESERLLDVSVLSLLVIQAFGAAAIGLFRSLPIAFVGGLALGVLQQLVSKLVASHQILQGLNINVPFIALFVLLLVVPRKYWVAVGRPVKNRAVPASPFSIRTRSLGYGAVLVGALLVPELVGTRLPIWTTGVTQVVLFLSLGLLVRTSGQISLCHVGLAAVGAAGFGHMLADGVPWGLAVLIGGLIAVPVGAIIAIPACRLPSLYLGLATLGFGILLAEYAYSKSFFFKNGRLDTKRPDALGLGGDKAFYYLLLVIALVAIALVVAVERSRLGRLLRGVSDAPIALTTLGTNINLSRLLVFCISSFMAGISGATYASLFGAVNQDSFNYVQSLIVLAVLAISGRRTVPSAIVASILLYVIPGYIDSDNVALTLQLGFGIAAIVAAAGSQGGFGSFVKRQIAGSEPRRLDPTDARVRLGLRQRTTATGRQPVPARS